MTNHLYNFKYLFLFIISATIVSCVKSSDKQETSNSSVDVFRPTDTLGTAYENPKVTELKSYISQLDSTDMTSVTKASSKYKEIFANQPNSLCDSGFVVFQNLYDSIEHSLSKLHENDTTNYEPLFVDIETEIPQKLKNYQKQLAQNGFKLSTTEEITYIEQDRNYVAKNFYTFVTPEMKSYLSELQKENIEGFAINGSITISPRQLVDRTIWYEKFISKNPNFIYIDNCINYRKAYFTYLMTGYENTTLYSNVETKQLSDYFKRAYDYLKLKYANSETTQMVLPYYKALELKQTSNAQAIIKDYHIKGLIYSL